MAGLNKNQVPVNKKINLMRSKLSYSGTAFYL